MKHNLTFVLKMDLDNCLSKKIFLPLSLLKVDAFQSYAKYFIQEIHEIKIA